MKEQNAKNHVRFVPGFHAVGGTLLIIALVLAITNLVRSGISLTSAFMLVTVVILIVLFSYTRRFSTGNQDRIIRAEENFRCYRLTGKTLDPQLTIQQVVALRFADDAEYPALAERTIKESLTLAAIKQAVQHWQPDHQRV